MTETEKVRLLTEAMRYVLDTLTEVEASDAINEARNEAECVKVDPYDFHGETLEDLLGGEVVSILPAGDAEGLELVVYSPGEYLTFISGWADFCCANRDDETFDIERINIMKHGRVSSKVFRALCAALRQTVRQRAREELQHRRGGRE